MSFLHRKWIDVSSFDIMRFISEMMQHPLCSRLYHTAVFCEQGEMLLDTRIQKTLFKQALFSFSQGFRFPVSWVQIDKTVKKRRRIKRKKPLCFEGILLRAHVRP